MAEVAADCCSSELIEFHSFHWYRSSAPKLHLRICYEFFRKMRVFLLISCSLSWLRTLRHSGLMYFNIMDMLSRLSFLPFTRKSYSSFFSSE